VLLDPIGWIGSETDYRGQPGMLRFNQTPWVQRHAGGAKGSVVIDTPLHLYTQTSVTLPRQSSHKSSISPSECGNTASDQLFLEIFKWR
jgi:hypothetical protein